MGLFDPLKVNQPIEIEISGDELTRYRSRVEIISPDKLVVMAPMRAGNIIPLRPKTVIKIIYTDNVAIYTFTSEVISQNYADAGTVIVGKPIDVRRIQRRNFVRLDKRLAVTLCRVDNKLSFIGEPFSATTVDLSGGGIMFGCNNLLKNGEILEATIYLDEHTSVRAIGRIVRFIQNHPKAKDKYSVGFEFAIVEEMERDKIIRFIFNQQRELRKKCLL